METNLLIIYIILFAAGFLFNFVDDKTVKKIGKVIVAICLIILVFWIVPYFIQNGGGFLNLLFFILPFLVIVLIASPNKKLNNIGAAILVFIAFCFISAVIFLILFFMTCIGVIHW